MWVVSFCFYIFFFVVVGRVHKQDTEKISGERERLREREREKEGGKKKEESDGRIIEVYCQNDKGRTRKGLFFCRLCCVEYRGEKGRPAFTDGNNNPGWK